MAIGDLPVWHLGANVARHWATVPEFTSRRTFHQARRFTFQGNTIKAGIWVWFWVRAQQAVGVRVARFVKNRLSGAFFNQASKVQNAHTVGDMAHNV